MRFEHKVLFLPKFHPELNPIERVWGKAKTYTCTNCDYTFDGLQRMVTPALESVSLNTICKFFRKSRNVKSRRLFWVKAVLCLPDSVKEVNSHVTHCVCSCTQQLSVVCIAP